MVTVRTGRASEAGGATFSQPAAVTAINAAIAIRDLYIGAAFRKRFPPTVGPRLHALQPIRRYDALPMHRHCHSPPRKNWDGRNRDLFSESREQMDDDYAFDIRRGARRAN